MTDSDPGEFLQVGGSLAVDFVNTEVIERDQRVERLRCDRDLLRWAQAVGLDVSSKSIGRAAAHSLSPEAHALRESLRALFEASAGGHRPPTRALHVLNETLASVRGTAPLVYKRGAFERESDPMMTPQRVLLAVAVDASEVLTGEQSGKIRHCANDHCILLFLDRSHAAKRRWCSMQVCGNRAKVAAHQRRARRG